MATNTIGGIEFRIRAEGLPPALPLRVPVRVRWKPKTRHDVAPQFAEVVVEIPNGNMTFAQMYQAIKTAVTDKFASESNTLEEGSF